MPRGCYAAALAADDHVLQHKARPTRAADAVAEIVRLGPRVGADPHLIEGVAAAAAHHRGEDARIQIADHRPEALDRTRIHRERLVAVKAGGKLYTPQLRRRDPHTLFELGDEGIGRAL